jgi:acyl-CoA-binding protein
MTTSSVSQDTNGNTDSNPETAEMAPSGTDPTEAGESVAAESDAQQDGVPKPLEVETKFGLSLEELYRLAKKFFKEQEGKALHSSYDDRNKLIAFTRQVAYGPYAETTAGGGNKKAPDVGYFDFVGNDRMSAWETLGNLSREEAMAGFTTLLDQICPPFKVYIEANQRDIQEKKQQAALEEERLKQEQEAQRRSELEMEAQELANQQLQRQELHKQQIQEALNKQTYHQFRAYAEQQVPGNPQQQEVLIKQLQDQHFQQYMQQVYAQHMLSQQQQQQQASSQPGSAAAVQPRRTAQNGPSSRAMTHHRSSAEGGRAGVVETDEDSDGGEELADGMHGQEADAINANNPSLPAASMWTRKDVVEFKEAIRKESNDGIVKVGNGETVTVRVPTHEDGTCLFWEFATDSYDLGFGVYFEWTQPESNTVSVHVSELSEDEDEFTQDGLDDKPVGDSPGDDSRTDIERGCREKDATRPLSDEVIPVYRRDCHEEVYAGSHVYPGQGVYLLKFDNSYSLWRSKTLYYRVYYSR